MNYYPHHIGDFNNATRHLTRVERALYRDLIELYYDTEQPLPADDFDKLARRVIANTDDEKAALKYVLDEFFDLDGDVYRHSRCEEEINKYQANNSAKARAGKASAEARKRVSAGKNQHKKAHDQQNSTGVERALNGCATNQEPRTNNQDIQGVSDDTPFAQTDKSASQSPPEQLQSLIDLPLNKTGEVFGVMQTDYDLWCKTYPAVNVWQDLLAIAAWLDANPAKRKTRSGMKRFINSWLSRTQDRGGNGHATQQQSGGQRIVTNPINPNDTSWADDIFANRSGLR